MIAAAVAALPGIALEETSALALMERMDTKYAVRASLVPALLARCADDYRVVDVAGIRVCRYSTLYYDSSDLRFYHRHHAGGLNRHKVRIRTYEEPGTHFLEVKLRDNHGRTLKSRVAVASRTDAELAHLGAPALRALAPHVTAAELQRVLRVEYRRITLVGTHTPERVTIDTGLRFTAGDSVAEFPGLAIVEVKQPRRSGFHFRGIMRGLHVQPGALSKYCLGIATLWPGARTNRFKPAIRRIRSIR